MNSSLNGLTDQTPRVETIRRMVLAEAESQRQENQRAKQRAKPTLKQYPKSETEKTVADLSDQELLDAACSSLHSGATIQALYRGDWTGYESQSQADMVMCNLLAFITGGDAERMDRMIRASGLHRPEKWDRFIPSYGRTYGENTIAEAIAGTDNKFTLGSPATDNGRVADQADSKAANDPTEWPDLKREAFSSSRLPAFPLEIYPDWCRGYLEKVVEIGQVPTCFAGMPFLGALAIAFQKRFKVSLNFVWAEALVLWILLIAPSGARKSPAFKCVVRFPLREWERQMAKNFKDVQIQAKKAIQDKQTAIEIAKKAKESTADLEQELESLSVPPTPKLYTGTATPEAIEEKLGLHLGRYAFASAESDILAVLLGKYKQGQPPIEGLMAAREGEDLKSDFRTREDVDVNGAHFTQIVFTQPPNAAKMFSSEALSGRGALGRYLPCLPHCELSEDLILEDVDIGLKSSYLSGFMRLLPSEEETRKAYESGDWHTREMTLSAEAWNVFEQFYKRTVRRRRVGGDLQFLEEWAPKFHGQVVRIAAILHLCDHYDKDEPPLSISVSAIQRAIRLGEEYLIPHAKAAYGEAEVFQADKVWDVLQRSGPEVNRRTIQQEVKPMSADELDRILESLEDAGYLRVEERSNGKRGRNPKFITLNPKAPKHLTQQQGRKPSVNLRPVGPIAEPATVNLQDVDLEDIL